MPKIFIFVSGVMKDSYGCEHDVLGTAIAEDGTALASHLSSSIGFLKHDMGYKGSDWKHDLYKAHYPDGYELEWVDDPEKHEGLQKAFENNKKLEEVK